MKLIAGLGNPGQRYAASRHSVGYRVVDELARRWSIDLTRYDWDFEGVVGEGSAADQRVLLLKPTTYVNLSGRSVSAAWRFYKLTPPDLLIIYDDLDLPVGRVRIRAAGSPGGHKGMSDIIRHLGTEEFARLRVGIGKVHKSATVEYVLGRFEPHEREPIEAAVVTAADAAECWIREGIAAAMNQFNRRRDGRSEAKEPPPDQASPGGPS